MVKAKKRSSSGTTKVKSLTTTKSIIMEKNYYLSSTFNEVIFRNRNKIYGAYYLRRVYEKHILVAIFIATAVFTATLAGPVIQKIYFASTIIETQQTKDKLKDPRIIDLEVLPSLPIPEKPAVQEQTVQAQKQEVKTEVYAETRVVRDDANVETKELANQEDLKNANFGTERIEGAPPTIPDVTVTNTPPAGLGDETKKEAPEVFIYVEEMPEFVGGEKAMLQYISRKMSYPASAQRMGIEGLVVVSFVVDAKGKITEAEIVKGLGHGTEEEALKVVNSMPDWKPGKQNGRAVAVRYTLPIRFSIK